MSIRTITDQMRDFEAPDEVKDVIRSEPRSPEMDPTLGIRPELSVKVNNQQETPQHRLVTIGDSLTQGFQSGAIFNTDISYPMIIAWEMGWDEHLRHPTPYSGWGGLPLNVELLVRRLEQELGDQINWWELGTAVFAVRQFMADVEDYWERGRGVDIPNQREINHNLAVYGWDLRDTLSRNAKICEQAIKEPKDNLFLQLVENANERAALRVLKSARDPEGTLTPLQAAAKLGEEGTSETGEDGIETLIILLGANNILGSVVQLRVVWSDAGFDNLEKKGQFNAWLPSHFQTELNQIVEQVRQIRARHVIWGTVPHVTIAPLARGVASKVAPGSRYFPYYTYPWISDRDFDPKDDPCITEQQARALDSVVDEYNKYITEAVKAARTEGKDWYILDVAGLLDRLASRRYIDDPLARPEWWTHYELPPELQELSPVPDSRFFRCGPIDSSGKKFGRTSGGLFSLDGIHPTTIGYGILAQEFINIMQLAGVKFYLGDGRTVRPSSIKVDFKRLIALDTLIGDPPRSLTSDLSLFGWLDKKLDIFKRLLRHGS